jgi:transcriptional regulator with XRE-family HTH domain
MPLKKNIDFKAHRFYNCFMKLKQYISEGHTLEKVSKKAAVSCAFLSMIANGKRRPSPEVAVRIQSATDGMVTAIELVFPNDEHISGKAA